MSIIENRPLRTNIDTPSHNGYNGSQLQYCKPESGLARGDQNYRYRRYGIIKVNPILSESSQDEGTINNLDSITDINIPNTIVLTECNNQNLENIHIDRQDKKERKKKVVTKVKARFEDQTQEWDDIAQWGLPEQCKQINRQHKKKYYNELEDSILACITGKCRARTIFISGAKQTAKKTILFDLLSDIKSPAKGSLQINQYFLAFEELLNNDVHKKIITLLQFLKNNVSLPSKKINHTQAQQEVYPSEQRGAKVENIIILDDYKSFIVNLRNTSKYRQLKKLLQYNQSSIIIFIDNCIMKKEIQMLTWQNYLQISMPNNTKEYFLSSFFTTIHNYPFKNHMWQIMRPIANYFSTKMEQNNKLHLSIIRKLIYFLQNQKCQDQMSDEKLRVNRQILQRFMNRFVDRTIKVDLRKLTIHEKAVMTACYVNHRQHPQILIPIGKLYKTYIWICQSLSMRMKEMRQFTQYVIFQLSIYKLIKVEKSKSQREYEVMVNVDIQFIRHSLSSQVGLAKFYENEYLQ